MSKIRVIDLLNKIANGEIPNRILYDHYIWSWTGDDYRTEIDGKEQFLITGMYYTWFTEFVNDEVEIIEEDKKIGQLEDYVDFANLTEDSKFDYLYEMISRLIEEVNKLKEKE